MAFSWISTTSLRINRASMSMYIWPTPTSNHVLVNMIRPNRPVLSQSILHNRHRLHSHQARHENKYCLILYLLNMWDKLPYEITVSVMYGTWNTESNFSSNSVAVLYRPGVEYFCSLEPSSPQLLIRPADGHRRPSWLAFLTVCRLLHPLNFLVSYHHFTGSVLYFT
jgi:hypothetical protein